MNGTKLTRLPSTLTTWGKWGRKHPQTDVLTPATGYVRDYAKNTYEDYYETRRGPFGFLKGGPGAEEKELVVGINVDNIAKAHKLQELHSTGQSKDKIDNNTEITLELDAENDKLTVKDLSGNTLDHLLLYWFVWKGIHPEAEVYTK